VYRAASYEQVYLELIHPIPPPSVGEGDFSSRLQACNAHCLGLGQDVEAGKAVSRAFTLKVVGDAEKKENHYYHGGECPGVVEIEALLSFLRNRATSQGLKGFLLMNRVLVKRQKDLFKGGEHAIFTISFRVFNRRRALHANEELRSFILGGKLQFSVAADIAESKRRQAAKIERSLAARSTITDEPLRRYMSFSSWFFLPSFLS